jgi:outer membrane autotransporter protein
VNVAESGNVTTYGDGSHAIFAQSIGGGGGEGGNGVIGATGKIGIGGGTGSTGNGGDVNITLTNGTITTYGNGANGVFAQSIGGGGGAAGDVVRGLANYLNVGVGLAFGQGSGNGGDGGTVTILSSSNISTSGTGSNGILAQSIGGGGGVAGSLGNDLPVLSVLNFAGSTGGAGSGGVVNVTETGTITTTGDASNGIFAQSAGGTDHGSAVNVEINGSILTSGMESNGILAQSVGTAASGNVTVTVDSNSTVQGGMNTGAGVRIMDGLNDQLTNNGTILTLAGMSGTSIVATGSGNASVDNYGTVNDSVGLGTGTNVFNNHKGGLLQSGDFINLGANGVLNDSGIISPGGRGTVQQTSLTGNFNLTGDSSWLFDLTPTFTSDSFAISGAAHLNGYINSINLNELGIANSPGTYTLITAAGGLLGSNSFQFGSMTGGTMPVGYTFNLINSDTAEQLSLTKSTGYFYWRGTVDNTWNGAFQNGQDNWTRDAAGTNFIFGTPGVLCDVFFATSNANAANLNTLLGADFAINSLTVTTPNAVSIGGNNTLTIVAATGAGITVDTGAGATTISTNIVLGGNQTWLNQSSNLLSIVGPTVTGSGQNLIIDGTGNTAITSAIETGTGSLTKNGTGTLFVTGTNTYSGGTILNAGTLDVDTSSVSAGVLPSVSPIANGPIGVGLLTINSGIIGTSTYNGSHTVDLIGNVVLVNGNFAISNVVTPTPSTPLSPIDGGVVNSFAAGFFNSNGIDFGGLVFLNQPKAPTVITTNSGFLALTGSVHDATPGKGGGLTFAGNTFTYIGSAGAANLGFTAQGLPQVDFQRDVSNSYAGTTTVASGVVVLGKNNNAVAIPGNLTINAGAYVQFDGANSVTRVGALGATANQIAMTASVVDNGTLDLAGMNQTIAALYGNGIVKLSDANLIYGTGVGAVGVLTVGSGNFSGVIEDQSASGQLVKISPGILILSGRSTYLGGTFINGGTLAVEGSLLSQQIYVGPGATLKGTGFIVGNVVNRGTVSPGNSPGTLRIARNYTQGAGGSLTIEIGGKAPALHDLLLIQGSAGLSGNLQLVKVGNFRLRRGDSIDFLAAAQGVNGKFTSVENPFVSQTILKPTVVYGKTTVSLELVQGSFAQMASEWGLTPNERAVAKGLDHVVNDSREAALINWLDNRELKRLAKDFDKISPEELTSIFSIGTSLANVQAQNLARRTEDIRNGRAGFSAQRFAMKGDEPSYSGEFNIGTGVAGPNGDDGKVSKEMTTGAPSESRWGAFLSGTGQWVRVGNTGNASGYSVDSGGFTLGIDYKVTSNFAVGLMAGYTGTTSDLTEHGRVWVNGGKLGLYSTVFSGGWYADVAAFGGYNSYDTRRSALQGEARGSTRGGEVDAMFDTGYEFKSRGWTFGPTATFNYTYVGSSAFAEHGSLAPLDIHGGEGESLRTAFGFKASYDWKVRHIIIRPEFSAAWQHEFGDTVFALNSNFGGSSGSSFLADGPRMGRDSALLGAGISIQLNERVSTYFYYDGELGRKNFESNSVTGGLRVAF